MGAALSRHRRRVVAVGGGAETTQPARARVAVDEVRLHLPLALHLDRAARLDGETLALENLGTSVYMKTDGEPTHACCAQKVLRKTATESLLLSHIG